MVLNAERSCAIEGTSDAKWIAKSLDWAMIWNGEGNMIEIILHLQP